MTTTKARFFKRPRLWGLICGLTLALAQLFTPANVGTAQAATETCTPNGAVQDCTVTFAFTGAPETWTVPAGVTQATFDLYGAQGGHPTSGGKGGRVTATLAVTPAASYQVRVGGTGDFRGANGFNGGGSGESYYGGGASDVRLSAFTLADRLLVAAGGGGASQGSFVGGAGGYPNGGDGANGTSSHSDSNGGGGGGATQTAGGAGGASSDSLSVGSAGSLGQGGNSGARNGSSGGGGGGGGYYGGGGGGSDIFSAGGGGGGSSYATPAATGVSFETGVRSGNGLVIISYSQPLPDTTAPVANPTQSPAAAPSGWNNSNVTVTWNWSDPATSAGTVSGIDAANCTTSSVVSGSATVTVNATCRDLAGNIGTATYSVRIDPTAPTANPSQSPAANAAGWNNTDVTVNWNWTFTGAEIDTANCTNSLTSSGEGTLTLSVTCKDVALNQRTVPYTVKVDKSAPVVTVTGVSDGASYTVGSVPTATCNTSDATSGVATQATVTVTGGGSPLGADGTGNFTATCSGATDNAGNSAAAVSVSYSVESAGVLVGVCGGYEVRQIGNSYTAAGWSGNILVGTNSNNTLSGTNGPDLILGLGGNDKIDGKSGDDVICGGDGVDLLLGGSGNDHLDGGSGNDVLNGGSGDYDELLGGEGNDTLLDGDGVRNVSGGAGNDLLTIVLRKGWRDGNGQANFAGLTAGYGNDLVGLAILDRTRFLVDISGDERDNPASSLEGKNDSVALAGVIDPASSLIKFEKQLVISADAEVQIPSEEAGAEYLTEPVGEESSEDATLTNRIFLPVVSR